MKLFVTNMYGNRVELSFEYTDGFLGGCYLTKVSVNDEQIFSGMRSVPDVRNYSKIEDWAQDYALYTETL